MKKYGIILTAVSLALCSMADTAVFGNGDWYVQGLDTNVTSTSVDITSNDITFTLHISSPSNIVAGENNRVFSVGDSVKMDDPGDYVTLSLAVSGAGTARLTDLSLKAVEPGSVNGSIKPERLLVWDNLGKTNSVSINTRNPIFTYSEAPLCGLNELSLTNIGTWSVSIGSYPEKGTSSFTIKNIKIDYNMAP